ncbi:hypothetical protein Fot_28417 [Forsythia ovata]|uniref:Uncharacterized protein n=1 Tax=Forsythia ovata TaxID=205694 RepID=A0ABD1TP02_9LAMI
MNEIMDANWILQNLGKDSAGKRVEIHQPSNNSWNRRTIIEVIEGTSIVSIALDDGKANQFELGKQGIQMNSNDNSHEGTSEGSIPTAPNNFFGNSSSDCTSTKKSMSIVMHPKARRKNCDKMYTRQS